MGDLSRALLVSGGNVTSLVRQLEAQGHVTLTVAPSDRRSQIVALTPVGISVFEALAAAHHGWIGAMLGGVPADQQEMLFALLGVVKTSIAREDGEEE